MSRPRPAQTEPADGGGLLVPDVAAANRLFNRYGVGRPQSGNTLRLRPAEAVHAALQGWIKCKDPWALLDDPAAEAMYRVYADLKSRGLMVEEEADRLEVAARDAEGRAFTCHVATDRTPAVAADVLALATSGSAMAIVDEDGAVTYYSSTVTVPQGTVATDDGPARVGRLVGDRVHVDDTSISLLEAAYLQAAGAVDADVEMAAVGAERLHHFTRTLPVYGALRRAGVLPKSGFRFGTHLRAYDGPMDETHAQWLIQCARHDDTFHWSELSRAVRLAHGVRKTFLLAIIGADQDGPDGSDRSDAVSFAALAWMRP